MSNKVRQINKHIEKLRIDKGAEALTSIRKGEEVDIGLVNQFAKHEFIPNKWFDWERFIDAEIVIIGQDWGPYVALKKFIDEYEGQKDSVDFNYDNFLFETFSSRTEKFIFKALGETFQVKYEREMVLEDWEKFFFTIAVLFTRQGIHFRGSHNFDAEKSRVHSLPYLREQLKIVSPKIIIPLGNLALKSVDGIYNLGIGKKTITKVVDDLSDTGYMVKDGVYILPNFHPAAHVSPKLQTEIWGKLWDII